MPPMIADVRKITEIQFKAWEPEHIIPDMKRGWPDPIRNVAATPLSEPPGLDGTLTHAAWKAVAVVEPQTPFFHDNPLVRTQVFLCWDNRHLYVGIRADLPPGSKTIERGGAENQDRQRAERVTIALDRRHTHDEMVALSINALGELAWVNAGNQGAGFSNEVGYQTEEGFLREMNPDPAGRAREMGLRGAARFGETEWTAEMAIPLKSLTAELPVAGLTMGLEVTRTATERPVEKFDYHFTWTEPYEGVLGSPVKMGILSFGPTPISLEMLDFPNCSWGINHASVRFGNHTDQPLQVVMLARGLCGANPQPTHEHEPVKTGPVDLPAGQALTTLFAYHMPVRYMPDHIELTVREQASGDRLLRVTYRLGTCAVVYPFGQERGMPSPALDDPDFIEKRMRYIVSRQPLLRRRTTRQGAPSDYYIEAVDGSVTFDLMQDGVMQKIADWLCGLYDTDVDRLIGSAFFMAQQAVYVYAARRAFFSVMINPLSNLRLGGGMCGEFARSHVGLLHLMKSVKTGKPFRARQIGVGGHALTTVWMDDRWVLLDPTTCNIKAFFLRDHQTLASGQDLRHDPTLIAENGSSSLKFAHPLLVHEVVCGTNWPDGAPQH